MFHAYAFARRWAWPAGGLAASRAGLQNFTTTGIFVISGLGLRRGEVRTATWVAPAAPVVGGELVVSGKCVRRGACRKCALARRGRMQVW